jgi:SAM-dependent methyltransferase
VQNEQTKEEQYKLLFDVKREYGNAELGLMANASWQTDPRRFLFTLSRYKFVSKMFEGMEKVLEIGCADAFATRLIQQTVDQVVATDFDPIFVADVENRMNPKWPMKVFEHDILEGPVKDSFDGIYCLDVLEHISVSNEDTFMLNSLKSLKNYGVMIVGMPSLESQVYASPASKIGHVNCKSGSELKALLNKYFNNVFLFSMNDEVVHTGFHPMAHYLLALCCGKRNSD